MLLRYLRDPAVVVAPAPATFPAPPATCTTGWPGSTSANRTPSPPGSSPAWLCCPPTTRRLRCRKPRCGKAGCRTAGHRLAGPGPGAGRWWPTWPRWPASRSTCTGRRAGSGATRRRRGGRPARGAGDQPGRLGPAGLRGSLPVRAHPALVAAAAGVAHAGPVWAGAVACLSHGLFGMVTKSLYAAGVQSAVGWPPPCSSTPPSSAASCRRPSWPCSATAPGTHRASCAGVPSTVHSHAQQSRSARASPSGRCDQGIPGQRTAVPHGTPGTCPGQQLAAAMTVPSPVGTKRIYPYR
jgi:hypothetical protein